MDPLDADAPNPLLAQVRQLIDAARQRVASAVNAELTQLYWHIGRRISAELLQGQRGEYGKQVVAELARQLTAEFGKRYLTLLPRAQPCRPSCTSPLPLPLPAKSWAVMPIHKTLLAAQPAAPSIQEKKCQKHR